MRVRQVLCVLLPIASATACEEFPIVCAELAPDACRKAEDLGYMISVQHGDRIATGNVIVGEAGALRVPGRVSLAVRATGVRRDSPLVSGVTVRTDGTVNGSTFGVERGTAKAISFDVAMGALPGFQVGGTRVGAVDALLGVSPSLGRSGGDVRITRSGLGVVSGGLRVGLLSDDGWVPALSLTGLVRDLPSADIAVAPMQTTGGGTATITIDDIDMTTIGVRLAATKRLGRLSLTGGVGRDRYRSRVSYQVNVRENTAGTDGGMAVTDANESRTSLFKISRNTAFGGVSWSLGSASLSAELGRVSGGPKAPTFNTFAPRPPNARRGFVTLGMTLHTGRTGDHD